MLFHMTIKKIQKTDLLAIYKREKKHLVSAVKEGNYNYHIF